MKPRLNIFGIQLVLRIVLICMLSIGLGFSVVNKPFFFIPVILIAGLCITVINLYLYLKKTNENLYNFLLNLKHQDFQTSFPKTNKNGHFVQVNTEYNEILRQFERKQEERKHIISIMELVFDHVEACILVYKQNGEVAFMNTPFKHAFNLKESAHIQQIYEQLPFPCFQHHDIKENRWVLNPEEYNYRITEPWHVKVKYSSVYNTNYKICFFTKDQSAQQDNTNGWLSFIKVISHEIGNGITPIRSIAETLIQDESSDTQHSDRVKKGLSVIVNQADDLLEFSERYRQLVQLPELKKQLYTFGELLDELQNQFEYMFKEKGIQFKYYGDTDYAINMDRQLMKQAFNNLLLNSIWAIEDKLNPKITIHMTKRYNDTLIVVEDNGVGIPGDKKHQIFIPFYTSKHEGSGIGLSLTQQIIWKHNGRIFVESESGEFTRFMITLND